MQLSITAGELLLIFALRTNGSSLTALISHSHKTVILQREWRGKKVQSLKCIPAILMLLKKKNMPYIYSMVYSLR